MLSSIYKYILSNHPYLKPEEISDISKVNRYDYIIKFKDGTKMLFDSFDNTDRMLMYTSDSLTDEDEKKEFGINLDKLIRRNFVSQSYVASHIGISQAAISKYINGYSIPNSILLKKLSQILNCKMEDFFYKNY